MAINIKNSDVINAARKLAELTGESMTTAILKAVQERLTTVRHKRDRATAEQLVEIGRECAARLTGAARTSDHADLLYDEKGLPR